jgi:hypothetical protein
VIFESLFQVGFRNAFDLLSTYAGTAADLQPWLADAEINRDEVPVALQPYVQQYFEQIRKSAPVAPPKK